VDRTLQYYCFYLWFIVAEEGGRLSRETYWDCMRSDCWLSRWKCSSARRESCR